MLTKHRPIITYHTQTAAENSALGDQFAIPFTDADEPVQGLGHALPTIRIVSKNLGEKLAEPCRIDFSRLDTITPKHSVCEFGDVHPDHIKRLADLWFYYISGQSRQI